MGFGRDSQTTVGGDGGGTIAIGGMSLAELRESGIGFTIHGGAAGGNVLHGSFGRDTIYGGTGDDTIRGCGENDRLYGQIGDDILWGNRGNDALFGGAGDDMLGGGRGTMSFVAARVTIHCAAASAPTLSPSTWATAPTRSGTSRTMTRSA